MLGTVKDAFLKRFSGDPPSPVKASLVATVAGAAAGVVTYRVLRS
jgi:hypothetical protein